MVHPNEPDEMDKVLRTPKQNGKETVASRFQSIDQRVLISIINKIAAGHEYSKYWLNKMRIIEEGNCAICDTPCTARHMIFHCDRYKIDRLNYGISMDKFVESFKKKNTGYMKNMYNFVVKNRKNF